VQAQLKINKFRRSSDRTGSGLYVSQWLDAPASGTHVVTVGGTEWTVADSINYAPRRSS
jgi:hypothetical protein